MSCTLGRYQIYSDWLPLSDNLTFVSASLIFFPSLQKISKSPSRLREACFTSVFRWLQDEKWQVPEKWTQWCPGTAKTKLLGNSPKASGKLSWQNVPESGIKLTDKEIAMILEAARRSQGPNEINPNPSPVVEIDKKDQNWSPNTLVTWRRLIDSGKHQIVVLIIAASLSAIHENNSWLDLLEVFGGDAVSPGRVGSLWNLTMLFMAFISRWWKKGAHWFP